MNQLLNPGNQPFDVHFLSISRTIGCEERTLTSFKCSMDSTTISKSKSANRQDSTDETKVPEKQGKDQINLAEHSELKEQKTRERNIFFRIWFDLKKRELAKIAIGSFAAAFSGVSKPFFGFYIITIGVAYFYPDAKRKVGLYSAIFSAIGLLSLFSHTFQHYFYGVVGEKAMANLRRALYSGIRYHLLECLQIHLISLSWKETAAYAEKPKIMPSIPV